MKLTGLAMKSSLWEPCGMKPRRPTIKDSTHSIRGEGARRKAQQVAARAARKAAAKKAKLEAEVAASKEAPAKPPLGS
jgi:hypothetical protein